MPSPGGRSARSSAARPSCGAAGRESQFRAFCAILRSASAPNPIPPGGPRMVNDALVEAETRMKGAVRALEDDLSGIRTGRASPVLIERLQVEDYGTPTPLVQLATISGPG